MTEIIDILAREFLESRGNPTVEVFSGWRTRTWRRRGSSAPRACNRGGLAA